MGEIRTRPINIPLISNFNLRYEVVIITDVDLIPGGDYIMVDPWKIYVFKTTIFTTAFLSNQVSNGDKIIVKNLSTFNNFNIASISSEQYINTVNNLSYQGLAFEGAVEFVKQDSFWYSLEEKDKNYIFNQAVASDTWSIFHGLNKFPSVTVVDSGGNEVEGAVQHVDENNLIITFGAPFSGFAYIN